MQLLQRLHLLDLPDEVLLNIISFLDFATLRQTVVVNKLICHLAEPFLYETIKILDGEQSSALSTGLSANQERSSWIRSLLVSTRFGEEKGLACLPPYIATMRNLKHLRLETPDCNAKAPEERVGWVNLQDRYERIFESASLGVPKAALRCLPNLESCTLHFVDGQKEIYSMTKYAMLFLHPRLRSLTMSCASTDFPDKLLAPFQDDPEVVKSTALEYLHLEECDIHSPSLAVLLSFPKKLKALKISEGIRYDGLFTVRSSRIHGNVNPAELIEAIASQCSDTLEYLSLSLGHFRHTGQHINQYGHHLNLTMFDKIKRLELDQRTTHLIRSRKECDHETWRRLPPNLEVLKIFSLPLGHRHPFQAFPRAYFPLGSCLIRDKAKHGIPKLRLLIYSYEHFRNDETEDEPRQSFSDDGTDTREPGQRLTQVELAWKRLVHDCRSRTPMFRKAGVRLIIENVTLPYGFIPPYLYPEESPISWNLWDSDNWQGIFTLNNEVWGYGGIEPRPMEDAQFSFPV